MAIPVFQMPVGTPEQTSPWNHMMSNALKQYQQGIHARYAPEMIQADIFSKQIQPLAMLAANPLFNALHPEISPLISQILKHHQGRMMSGGQDGVGNSISDMIKNHNPFRQKNEEQYGNQDSQGYQGDQGDMQNPDGSYNPNGAQSTGDQYLDQTRNKLTQEQTTPGLTYNRNGESVLSPTGNTRTQAETATVSEPQTHKYIQRLIELSRGVGKDLSLKGQLNALGMGAAGAGVPLLKALEPQKIKQLQADIESSLIKNWNKTPEAAHQAVTKGLTESNEDFANKLMELDRDLSFQAKHLRKATREQISLNEKPNISNKVTEKERNSRANKVELTAPDGTIQYVAPKDVARVKAWWKQIEDLEKKGQ